MVSIVLVGHSPELLRGLRAMIAQSAAQVPVATAGGTSIGNLGTSSPSILAALKAALAAATGDGVVVLLDLGSAFLALEMALEELSATERALVRVSSGPLVEGAVLAAIEASSRAPVDRVVAVADAACASRKLPEGWTETGLPGDGEMVGRWIRLAAARIAESRSWLTDLDAAIGDGDHGINLDRGFAAVVAGLDAGVLRDSAPGPLLTAVGRTLSGTAGGASGALYGRAFMRAGSRLTGRAAGGGRVDAIDATASGRSSTVVLRSCWRRSGPPTRRSRAPGRLSRSSRRRGGRATSGSALSAISTPAPPRARCSSGPWPTLSPMWSSTSDERGFALGLAGAPAVGAQPARGRRLRDGFDDVLRFAGRIRRRVVPGRTCRHAGRCRGALQVHARAEATA